LRQWPYFVADLYAGRFEPLASLELEARTASEGDQLMYYMVDNSLGISRQRDAELARKTRKTPLGDINDSYRATRSLSRSATQEVDDAYRTTYRLTAPVLLVHGDTDFSTPIENNRDLVRHLSAHRLTTVRGGGTHQILTEVSRYLPTYRDQLVRFLASDSAPIPKLLESLPTSVQLPRPHFMRDVSKVGVHAAPETQLTEDCKPLI
jgi:pimeloyl-ACP methyl ester carboxylesterase